jgi:predicted transcriptional regulator
MVNVESYPLSLGLDHPSIQQVIQIALELTEEHKVINTELLYNRAKRFLKIPGSGLKTIIQMLLNRKILVDGSRFTRETVLKNDFRYKVYKIIKTNIGAHFSFLKNEISDQKEGEMGVGHLIWHLEKLLEFNLIKKVKVKNCTIFLPVEIDDDIGILHFFLRDEVNRKIVEFLLHNENVKKADIYKELNSKREKTYYHINKLIESEILSSNAEDDIVFVNPSKKDLIIEVINSIMYRNRVDVKPKLLSLKT